LYEKPALAEGKFWGGPPRGDFLTKYHVLYQEGDFLDDIERKVWNSVVRQLVREYGPNLDLNKANILNADFVFQRNPEKLPQEIIQKIKERTLEELGNLKK
jgi:hypothetical protein